MADRSFTVAVTDRGRVIAEHTGLSAGQARELATVYRLLGYRPEHIHFEPVRRAA